MEKILRNVFLLLMLIMAPITLSSCSDDEDGYETSGNTSITGIWETSEMTINGKDAILRVEFNSNNKGSISAIYTDGTDPDSYNFEYVLKKEENGDTYLTIVWTGNFKLIYEENKEYNITITPSRLVWGSLTYIRR